MAMGMECAMPCSPSMSWTSSVSLCCTSRFSIAVNSTATLISDRAAISPDVGVTCSSLGSASTPARRHLMGSNPGFVMKNSLVSDLPTRRRSKTTPSTRILFFSASAAGPFCLPFAAPALSALSGGAPLAAPLPGVAGGSLSAGVPGGVPTSGGAGLRGPGVPSSLLTCTWGLAPMTDRGKMTGSGLSLILHTMASSTGPTSVGKAKTVSSCVSSTLRSMLWVCIVNTLSSSSPPPFLSFFSPPPPPLPPPFLAPLPSAASSLDFSANSTLRSNKPLLVMRSLAVWLGCAPSKYPVASLPTRRGPNSNWFFEMTNWRATEGVGGRCLIFL
mmetsp:Transcript_11407/g.31126  ORF Transcript_11407/g.31126 Transcript_11407/m.31126 type:complete len:330 (-) Transcript_11407:807-1796(-)